MKILLVEDDPLMRDSIKKFLEFEGIGVDAVANGEEAIKIMERHKYPVIITDILMPKMDGKMLIEYVKKHSKFTRIIAISGYIDEISGLIGKNRPDHILQKPFNLEELLHFVNEK